MSKNTLTFELGGRVEIGDLEKGITAFRRLLSALTPSQEKVAWVVVDLQPGSATATLLGESDNPAVVDKVIKDYEKVGKLLARRKGRLPYTSQVIRAADSVMELTSTCEYVRFKTADADCVIYGKDDMPAKSAPSVSIGSVTGRVQTLFNRGGLKFNLYGRIHDKPVACYMRQGQEELMREAWGKRARVTGRVYRDHELGLPISIRDIMRVEILENTDPWAYRNARGVIPWKQGDKLPEQVIREMRDVE